MPKCSRRPFMPRPVIFKARWPGCGRDPGETPERTAAAWAERMKRSQWVGLGILAALVVVTVLVTGPAPGGERGPQGTLALRRFLARMGIANAGYRQIEGRGLAGRDRHANLSSSS